MSDRITELRPEAGRRRPGSAAQPAPDWKRVTYIMHLSRSLDDIEEGRLVPERKVLYQFCARGHELSQILLGLHLTDPHDGIAAYYRGRPLALTLGLDIEDASAATLMRVGSPSGGRDIGVLYNLPGRGRPTLIPTSGGVGTQYTPVAGWAQAIRYRKSQLGDASYARSIAVVHGGDASTASNGFWSALNQATTLRLPMLFFVEDNGYGISVRTDLQTPGGNIAANLAAFRHLTVLDGDGTDPVQATELTAQAVSLTREHKGPVFLRLTMPRLSGHSAQDTQTYKSAEIVSREKERDPVLRLNAHLVPGTMSQAEWNAITATARRDAEAAVERALARPMPEGSSVTRFTFSETDPSGRPLMQLQGGVAAEGLQLPAGSSVPRPEPTRINMITAIRRTLEVELVANPRLVIFGEDVGPKGGVHGATLGMQEKFGRERIFDTSLNEEGIIGRAVGMSLAGLTPVPEIQFRKYAEPASEQLHDCGSLRWRTSNRFAAPIVVRMPGGFGPKCGDPWHSQCNEAEFLHAVGWRVAMPSNAEDAVGLLRTALRGNDPTIFFEHRSLLDAAWSRRPYPGDDYVLPFGKARIVRKGDALTVVSWAAMAERCDAAIEASGIAAELIDLRTLSPWDRPAVLESVRRTRRCLIVHEDTITAGFGAEIAAVLAKEAFFDLDAPIERLAMPDIPSPHSLSLLAAALPTTDRIAATIKALAEL